MKDWQDSNILSLLWRGHRTHYCEHTYTYACESLGSTFADLLSDNKGKQGVDSQKYFQAARNSQRAAYLLWNKFP